MTNYQVYQDGFKYSQVELVTIFKTAAYAKGVKFLAFNDSNGNFAVDFVHAPTIRDVSNTTGLKLRFISDQEYDDFKSPTTVNTTTTQIKVSYNPENYTRYPVKAGEYPFQISKNLTNSPTRWTEIIREKTGLYLTSSSSTQLQAGEILLIPKSWTSKTAQENDYPPVPTDDPTKKKSGNDFLFLTALGYGIYNFIF